MLISRSLGVPVLDVPTSIASSAGSLAVLFFIIVGNTLLTVLALEYIALPSRTAVVLGIGLGVVQTMWWYWFGAARADTEAAAQNPAPAAVVESTFDGLAGNSLRLTGFFLIAITSWLCAGRTTLSPGELLPDGSGLRFLLAALMFAMVLLILNAFAVIVGFRTAGVGARALRHARSTEDRAKRRACECTSRAARSEARFRTCRAQALGHADLCAAQVLELRDHENGADERSAAALDTIGRRRVLLAGVAAGHVDAV